MQGLPAESTSQTDLCSRTALDFVNALLVRPTPEQPSLDGLLAELTHAFAARGAGLADLMEGSPLIRHATSSTASVRWPWQEAPDLLRQLRRSRTALAIPHADGGSLLLTTINTPAHPGWLLWIERDRRIPWSKALAATLTLAGQALARCLHDDSQPRWAEQLEQAARQQRLEQAMQVVCHLTHDFGNILTSILGFSELALACSPPQDSQLLSYLTEIHQSVEAGTRFTQQLRLFTRRETNLVCSCSLAEVVAAEETRFRSRNEPDVRLAVSLAADLPPLALDAESLRHVVAVLLENAREAVGDAGVITLSAQVVTLTETDCRDLLGQVRPGAHVEIRLVDTGKGLSAEAERRLFQEPFFSSKPRQRGMGLATTYGILQAHRGGIRLQSAPEGGVIARLVLPTASAPVPAAALAATASSCRGEKVLVVDDDPMILQFVSTTLQRAGYRVQAMSDPEEALNCYVAASTDPFRLVLSDVLMPRLSGVDLARRLLQRDRGVRVLFMSGQVSADVARQELDFELLTKPFRPEGLLRAVRKALDREVRRSGMRCQNLVGESPHAHL